MDQFRLGRRAPGGVALVVVLVSLLAMLPWPSPAQECQPTALTFSFSAEPAQPRVGDAVVLTIGIARTNTAGLPHVSLEGTVPLLGGDLMPDPPVSSSGPVPSSVSYHLTAVQAGEVTLTFHITFEGVTACSGEVGPVFGFLAAGSPPFTLNISAAGEGTQGPPTFTPTATPTATVPTATVTATPVGPPTFTPSPRLDCQRTELSFHLSAAPAHPAVGDAVVLTIAISETNTAGLPAVSLDGASPLLTGASVPNPPVPMSAPVPFAVSYHLTAVAAGDSTLTFHINFEGVTGCTAEFRPIFGFLSAASNPFALHIAAAEPTSTATPTVTATPSLTPTTSPGVVSSSGCSVHDARSAFSGLLLLPTVVAALRRRRTTGKGPQRPTTTFGG